MGVDVRSMARNIIREKYAMQASQNVAPVQQTISPARNDIRSSLRQLMGDAIDSSGVSGGYRTGLENLARGVDFAVDAVPLVGDAIAVQDTMDSYRRGDLVDTGINATAAALGVIPVVGDAAGRAVQAGGKKVRSALRDLDPSSKARMQRAEEGGFDTGRTVYRGQIENRDGFNQSLEGFSESIPEIRRGISVSTDTRVADQFAGYNPEQAGAVYPMYAKTQNTFDFRNPEHLAVLEKYIPEEGFGYGGQHPERPTLMARIADGNHTTIEQPLINQAMKDAGFDSSYVREGFDSASGKMESDLIGKDHYDTININVFDGSQLRSTNAEFDPTKADSSNLLSGISRSSLRDIA
jgi:hypothetical protein